ncbi:MAG: hypothetical protein IKQ44_12125 [Lachnospiraceae bacterium]|nr:hypothetical protein [Lachnospiraceae bacterium]
MGSLTELIYGSKNADGILPKSFSLPDDTEEGKPRFADGAMDGIMIYHMGHTPLTDEEKNELLSLLKLAAEGKFDEAEGGFTLFCAKHRVVSIIDDLQRCIVDNKDDLDPNNLYRFAVNVLTKSGDKECLKVGLSILELFDAYENENLADVIRTVGLSDEFTIFSVFNMRNWPNAEKEILDLAKKVRGWGRIHCVDFISADDEETRKWLLYNGVDNDVVAAYSAMPVYEKSGMEELIDKDGLSYEEMHAILAIAEALLDEGPVSGISTFDDPVDFLNRIIKKTQAGYELSEDDLRIIEALKEWKPE